MRLLLISISAMLLTSQAAHAQDDLCSARPGKTTPTCTLPSGAVQIETSVADWSADHSAGMRTDTVLIGDSLIRLGLGSDTEIGVNVTPFVHDRQRGTNGTDVDRGFGDMQLMLKHRILDGGDTGLSLAVQPFVSLPTGAHGVSDGIVTGGVALPMDINLPNDWSAALTPALQSEANETSDGSHALWSIAGSVSHPVSSAVTATAELYVERGYEPAEHQTKSSADLMLAWQPAEKWQFDIATYIGLNANTPDAQLLGGFTHRF